MGPGQSSQRLRIVVLGYIVRGPMGGLAWHYLQYVLGLAALGHDVFYLEASREADCFDPVRFTTSADPAYGLAFAAAAFERLALGHRWAYRRADLTWAGPAASRIAEIRRTVDLVLNVSAVNPIDDFASAPVRVFVDTDPGFTQIQHLTQPEQRQFAETHTAFFTFGENIARGGSTVPPDGLLWQATRQPLMLDAWPDSAGPADGPFTTLMLWNSYAPARYEGRSYGMKSASFAPYLSLPRRVDARCEVAAASAGAPAGLAAHGWRLVDPIAATGDPWAFQRYVQASRAEFSVAKEGYVVARTGWFSERSAGYLASGRPVVVQDTGFSDWLDTREGVVPFTSLETAVAGIERITCDYARHCRAAREIAGSFFDARAVLSSLVERAFAAA